MRLAPASESLGIPVRGRAEIVVTAAAFALSFATARSASAADAAPERQLTTDEINAWLDRPSNVPPPDTLTPGSDEAPPPPPRRHGVTVESGIGFLSHLGSLKNITPTSPWFHLKLGVEPLRWLMVFAETDLVISSTGYANPPPPSRAYHLYGFGGGARFTAEFAERFGAYLEGSAGLTAASSDVLEVYGYTDATDLNLYIGGRAGVDWYPVNPHLALSLHCGARRYHGGLGRELNDEQPFALLAGLGLRYTF